MELFGGLMVMVWILFFFLSVVWFVLPFVIFSMKGKMDRAVELLESLERRLTFLESRLNVPMAAADEPPREASLHTPLSESPQPGDGV
jgi:hypothetical protein